MMKETLKIGFIILSLFFVSCTKDWLDINEDPNTATSVEPKLLVNSAMLDYSANLGDAGVNMMYWSQHWAAGSNNDPTFSDKEIYRETGFTTDNTWRTYYTYALKNISLAEQIAKEDENSNGQAVCKLLSSLIFYHATIMWEDVPFTQALDHENYLYPEADDQLSILEGIIELIDEGISLIDYSDDASTMKTFFYYDEINEKEDMEKWERFGNSLKLRVLMILATKDETNYSSLVGELINNPETKFISSNTENCLFLYYNQTGNKNPFYRLWESYTNGTPAFFFPSEVLIDLMNSFKIPDPRMYIWFIRSSYASGEFKGVTPGEAITSESSVISSNVIYAATPHQIATCSETYLFVAEAYARGWVTGSSDLVQAKDSYEQGIRKSMEFYGVSNVQTYLQGLKDISQVDVNIAIEDINKQQYIDCFFKPHEGWVQVRRTGVPSLSVPTGAVRSGLIKRWFPPTAEINTNVNISFSKPLEQKMWLDP